jgi:HPt (histidine-containing phosphotransfer) domain-containing protein
MSEDEHRDVLDEAALWRNFEGDRELFVEIVQTFLRTTPEYLRAIRDAVASGDAQALESSAHRMKGGVSLFYATTAEGQAMRLLVMGQNNDLADAARTLAQLEHEIARLTTTLCELARIPVPGAA